MGATDSGSIPVLVEDIGDVLAMVDYENCVFSGVVSAGTPRDRTLYHDPMDKPQRGGLGGKNESRAMVAADAVNRHANRSKVPGVVQEMQKTWGVTQRAMEIDSKSAPGITNLEAESSVRAMEDLKQSHEWTFLSQQVALQDVSVLNDQATPALESQDLTGGASWYADRGGLGQSGSETTIIPTAFRPAAAQNVNVATVNDFDETAQRELLYNARKANHKKVDLVGFVSLAMQLHLDGFMDETQVSDGAYRMRSYNFQGTDPNMAVEVKSYRTSFGKVTYMPSDHLNAHRAMTEFDANGNAVAFTGTASSGSDTITVSSTRGIQPFVRISGTGIPDGAYVTEVVSTTTFKISSNTTQSLSGTTLKLGDEDHALFLQIEHFKKCTGSAGVRDVTLSNNNTGSQGYVGGFISLHCKLPPVQSKVFTGTRAA